MTPIITLGGQRVKAERPIPTFFRFWASLPRDQSYNSFRPSKSGRNPMLMIELAAVLTYLALGAYIFRRNRS